MADISSKDALIQVEDALLNIHALHKFLLFFFENTTGDELLMLKGEMVTMLYLLGEQVADGQARLGHHCHTLNHPPPPPDQAHAPA